MRRALLFVFFPDGIGDLSLPARCSPFCRVLFRAAWPVGCRKILVTPYLRSSCTGRLGKAVSVC
jgi:hypothetical protein